ncbi:hypothetical protein I4U23_018800 [Adineta vaga]|nr:hypothetical protein I4U23_018800 [Adineta vaga]
MVQVVQTTIIPREEDIDSDVFAAMASLGCFKDRQRLIEALLNSKHNTEKVIYFLLLDRKLRQPSQDDTEDTKHRSRSGSPDIPQKRIDRQRSNGQPPSSTGSGYRTNITGQLTEGSPLVSRRKLYSNISNKTVSANNTPSVSPCSSPTIIKKDVFSKITAFTTGKSSVENTVPSVPTPPSTQSHIHRHHRNTSTVSQNDTVLTTQPSTQSIACNSVSDQSYTSGMKETLVNSSNALNNGTDTYNSTRRHPPQPTSTSTSTTSESMNMESSPSTLSNNSNSNSSITSNNNQWRHKLNNLKQSFQNVGTPRFHRRPKILLAESDSSTPSNSSSQYGTTPEATKKSLFHHIIDAMQEDHHMIVVKDRPLAAIKTDLIHAFLSTPDLVHNVLSGTQYRCEYRRADRSSMFQRNIRFHVEICTVRSTDPSVLDSYYVTFTLITGQARRFKKLCEEIQTLFLTSKDRLAKQRRRTNEIRPISTNNSSTTTTTTRPMSTNNSSTATRPNASFISSLFGNTSSSYIKTNISQPSPPPPPPPPQQQQQSSSSSASSLSSTSNISLTYPPLIMNDDPSAIESNRVKVAHRSGI